MVSPSPAVADDGRAGRGLGLGLGKAKIRAGNPDTKGAPPEQVSWRGYLGVFRYSRRALALVWTTSRFLTIGLALGSVIAGLLPGAMAWVGKQLVDTVIHAAGTAAAADRVTAMQWVAVELVLVIGLAAITRTLGIFR